jgi:hypothetical protein
MSALFKGKHFGFSIGHKHSLESKKKISDAKKEYYRLKRLNNNVK